MEEHSFDGLAKEMADGAISRQRALKIFGAAVLGSALTIFMPETAEARRRNKRFGFSRRKRRRICGRTSFNFNFNNFNNFNNQNCCGNGIPCTRNTCRCPFGTHCVTTGNGVFFGNGFARRCVGRRVF